MKKTIAIMILFTCFNLPLSATADYLVTGEYRVSSCKGFVIEVCETVTIDAVEDNGKLYAMKKIWEKVDSYSQGTCYLNLTGKSVVPFLSKALNPNFYSYDKSGNLKEIKNIEGRVSFKCRKR